MNRKMELGNIIDNTLSIKEAKEELNKAKKRWEEFKLKAQEYQDAELLDYHEKEIVGDTRDIKEKRRKAIKSVKEKMKRNNTFSYLTRMVGKPKNSLTKLQMVDSKTNEMKTMYDRREIEKVLIHHNRNHFSKAKNTPAYRDRITRMMHKSEIRDKVLNGTLKREEIDNSDLYDFL